MFDYKCVPEPRIRALFPLQSRVSRDSAPETFDHSENRADQQHRCILQRTYVQEACVKVAGVREESGESSGRRGRNLKSTLQAVLLLSFLASSTWAQETRPKEENAARVLAMESLWNQAELQKDVQALDQLLSDKFIYVDVDGSLKTKPEFLKGVKNPPEHIGTIASESLAAEVYDTTVVVSGIYREKGTNHGTAYSRRGRFTDTWVKQGKSWLCVASQSTLIQK
jgi:ketosteroid isomerase-like protein